MIGNFLDSRNEKWLAMESAHDRMQVCACCANKHANKQAPRRRAVTAGAVCSSHT
jgi:hypothetical protein